MRPVLDAFARRVTSRTGRWVVIAVWIPLAVLGVIAHSHLNNVTSAGQSSFLPSSAESTEVVDRLQADFKGGDNVPVIIVFERNEGITRADRKAIGDTGEALDGLGIDGATQIFDPFAGEAKKVLGNTATIVRGIGPVSKDGEAALVALAIDADKRNAITRGVRKIRDYLSANPIDGVHAYVTGPAGIAADLQRVADQAGTTLLIVTTALVLLLLLLVYRAPILAVLPLIAVGGAYVIATAITYLLIKAGAITVNTVGTFLLLVLIFGAGTDYSLLLIHRYRENLEGGAETTSALSSALRESMGAIAASGGTVIAAMLVLLVADLESTKWLGPILAVGVAVMLIATFTLLPAILSVLGRRAFLPERTFAPREPAPRWTRLADLVRNRSRTIIVVVFAGLIVLSLGNLVHHSTIGFGQGVTRPTDSSRGNAVIDEHFPPGIGSPLSVLVDSGEAPKVVSAMESLPPVKLAFPAGVSKDGNEALVAVILRGNPYSSEAADDVEELRKELAAIDPGALVGGLPAENLDIEDANSRDTKLIVPGILLVVALILGLLLRAIVAPLYLMLTVVVSFAGALGLSTFLFTVLGANGIAFNLVLISFLFLVALGVDYNIFLMARAREESAQHGTRDGTIRALIHTGAVVTGAGLILAGTFATLGVLPLEELVQTGVTIALGILIDTFVVRAMLVPAIAYRLGERTWWPGSTRTAPPD